MGAPKGNKYAVGNKGGGVIKYTSKTLDQAKHYLENFNDYGDEIPSKIGLAFVLKVATETVRAWGLQESKKEFSVILEGIKQKQHQTLINKGLTGDFNSNIAKLVLGKHGYHEKIEHSGDMEITVPKYDSSQKNNS